MSTLHTTPNLIHAPREFRVIHPLDDVAETKCSTEGLGLIRMTPTVRLSLRLLRGYLAAMSLLLLYHVLDLAGLFARFH